MSQGKTLPDAAVQRAVVALVGYEESNEIARGVIEASGAQELASALRFVINLAEPAEVEEGVVARAALREVALSARAALSKWEQK